MPVRHWQETRPTRRWQRHRGGTLRAGPPPDTATPHPAPTTARSPHTAPKPPCAPHAPPVTPRKPVGSRRAPEGCGIGGAPPIPVGGHTAPAPAQRRAVAPTDGRLEVKDASAAEGYRRRPRARLADTVPQPPRTGRLDVKGGPAAGDGSPSGHTHRLRPAPGPANAGSQPSAGRREEAASVAGTSGWRGGPSRSAGGLFGCWARAAVPVVRAGDGRRQPVVEAGVPRWRAWWRATRARLPQEGLHHSWRGCSLMK
ncbi:hypothetical protein GA0115240_11162 [Streptomyces sp. DvalAA-14]|nr:hypothetical protein GA0115240_11162 [Streptomyces sp. DvalAA-14]